jgi:hypothetical protein
MVSTLGARATHVLVRALIRPYPGSGPPWSYLSVAPACHAQHKRGKVTQAALRDGRRDGLGTIPERTGSGGARLSTMTASLVDTTSQASPVGGHRGAAWGMSRYGDGQTAMDY